MASVLWKIISTLVVGILAALTFRVPAHADTYQQLCVQNSDGTWFAYVVETPEDEAAIAGLRTEPFPNTAHGCASYGPLASGPVVQTAPAVESATCEPIVKYVEVPVEVVRYGETSSTQTIVDTERVDELTAKTKRQRATIKRLRAKLRALR